MREIIQTFDEMRDRGLIEDYAVGGSVAIMAHALPILTDDLDIFVLLPTTGLLVNFQPVAEFLQERGYTFDKDGHVLIGGLPVHVLPTTPGLTEEALREAEWKTYRGSKIKVFSPEHLAAILKQLRRPKDLERLALLQQYKKLNLRKLAAISVRYGIR